MDIFDNDRETKNNDDDDDSESNNSIQSSYYSNSENYKGKDLTKINKRKKNIVNSNTKNEKIILQLLSIILKRQDTFADQLTRIERMISTIKMSTI